MRSARGSAKDPSSKAVQLHRFLLEAKALLGDWRVVSTDCGIPIARPIWTEPRGAYGQLSAELSHLERALGQSELEELGIEQLAGS